MYENDILEIWAQGDSLLLPDDNFDNNDIGIADMLKMCRVFAELNFDNVAVLEIGRDIIQDCYRLGKSDIVVSKTGDGEMLIYRKTETGYSNIIIDENADVEYLFIDDNRVNSHNEYHSLAMLNISTLTSKM